jgi:hypothetical protein
MRRSGLHSTARNALLLGVTATVSACAYSTEAVFTRQNQAAAALAMMGIEAEAQKLVKLDMIYAAETQLHEACAPLRSVASRRMNGEAVGIGSELQAMLTLGRCATRTDEVESFIRLEAPPVARLYLGPNPTPQEPK